MLDLKNPQTKFIFEASSFIDRIKDGCNTYINQNFQERQLTFEKIKSDSIEMLEFCKKTFPKVYIKIEESIIGVNDAANKLKEINNETEAKNVPFVILK